MAENQVAEPEAPKESGKAAAIKVVVLIVLVAAAGGFAYMAYQKGQETKRVTTLKPSVGPGVPAKPLDEKQVMKAVMQGMAAQNKANKAKAAQEAAPAAEGAAAPAAEGAAAPAAEGAAAPAPAPAAAPEAK